MKPNLLDMAAARAELDQRLNQVAVLTAPEADLATEEDHRAVQSMVSKHLKTAREALNKFEEAARGK